MNNKYSITQKIDSNLYCNRRSMIFGGAAFLSAMALKPGEVFAQLVASQDLWDMLENYPWVSDGGAGERRACYILFEPTCVFARAQYETCRPLLNKAHFRWIPFAARTRASRGATIRLSESQSTSQLQSLMTDGAQGFSSYGIRWSSVEQEVPQLLHLQQDIMPLVRTFSQQPIGSPTSIYKTNKGSVRLIRGAWNAEQFNEFFYA